jgi:hypothetical protein
MLFHWKGRKFGPVTGLILLMVTSAQLASAQTDRTKTPDARPDAISTLKIEMEFARLKPFLDKNGGYKDKEGGYFNPKAGTYTDAEGGVVDNWSGYTYNDGSYKSETGDFWDAPTKSFKLTTGEILKSDETTSAEAIKLMRETVEESGRYDKNYMLKSMIVTIKREHPDPPTAAHL